MGVGNENLRPAQRAMFTRAKFFWRTDRGKIYRALTYANYRPTVIMFYDGSEGMIGI
jgi:hypothetical protein